LPDANGPYDRYVLIELDPVDRLTTGAIGPAGARVFYLQGRKGDHVLTLLVEKQQVQLLAASVVEILSRVGKETGQGPPEEEMGLEEPVAPEWRAGRLSIGYQEERDLLMLEADELLPEDEDEDEADDEAEEGQVGDDEPERPPLTPLEAELEAELGPELEAELEADLGQGFDQVLEAELEREAGTGALERDPDARRARFWATREQMLSFARHGAAVCAAGRPRCQFCGNPIDPEGHVCPAMNGHRKQSSE
jgi:uncharacterized repeat protein (TIGR03847 family)